MGGWSDEPAGGEQRTRQPQLAKGRVSLSHGDPCPRCNVGLLYLISRDGSNVTLHCFACGTSGSHDESEGHLAVTDSPTMTPTGFTLSPAQAAAKQSDDPEEASHDALTAEQGSGINPAAGGAGSA